MYISKFQIINYKSYRNSGEIEFRPGFNILTGQNSAGKTALLEALTLQFTSAPHVSDATVPYRGAPPDPLSLARITFALTGEELAALCRGLPGDTLHWLPQPTSNTHLPSGTIVDASAGGMNRILLEMAGQEVPVHLQYESRLPGHAGWTIFDEDNVFGLYRSERERTNGQRRYFPLQLDQRGNLAVAAATPSFMNSGSDLRAQVAPTLRGRIYRFRAERFIIGESRFGNNPVLAGDASNLPEVLNVLDGNTARFQKLNALMREVLPQVKHVSVRPLPNDAVQILVWPIDYSTEKDYLAIPLNECGSGVAQVLAILYVLVTSEHSQTIIVDEPQSFLHPGAVRKLIEVLKRYPQHQYIFATHSPNVITASDPATVTIVRATEDGTRLQPIDPNVSEDLKLSLSELGARLSDVFGADNVLWVEGETEEECFPRILRNLTDRSLMGTAIVGIRQTGDFSRRDRERVLEMYRRLSSSNALLPPALAFIFDRECVSKGEMDDLTRMGNGQVHFLPRRCYENYLLHARAIAAVANLIEGFRPTSIEEDEVQRLLDRKRTEVKFYCKGTKDIPADWLLVIDGAGVIAEIFGELSENRVQYAKTRHSVSLTDWLLQNDPEELREIASALVELLPRA